MLPSPRPSLRNVLLIDATGVAVVVLYALAHRSLSTPVQIFLTFGPLVAIGMWIRQFARQTRVALPFDFGYLFLIFWPLLIPMFAKLLSPQRPWRLAIALYALGIAPTVAGAVADTAVLFTGR